MATARPTPVASLSLASPLLLESPLPSRKHPRNTDTPSRDAGASIGSLQVLEEVTPAAEFDVLAPNTDLHAPPPRWLQTDVRLAAPSVLPPQQDPGSGIGSRELDASALIASAGADVDFLGPGEHFKKLFRMPYSSSPVSMGVHRIGQTLVLDGSFAQRQPGNPPAPTADRAATAAASADAATASPAAATCATSTAASTAGANGGSHTSAKTTGGDQVPSPSSADAVSAAALLPGLGMKKKKNKQRVLANTLYSKFLYRSVHDAAADKYRTALQPVMPGAKGSAASHSSGAEAQFAAPMPAPPRLFRRTFRWIFHEFKLLMGNDAMIFSNENHPAVSLQLRDSRERLTVLQALDYWLDNVMASIPELAICYHRDGIVQSYDLIRTDQIPSLVQADQISFQPSVVHDHAKSVLKFLSGACTKPFGSYWLYRGAGERSVHLFDITDVTASQPSSMLSYPVAMLCYRMAHKMSRLLAFDDIQRARMMLMKTAELLDAHQHPSVFAATQEKLAASYLTPDPKHHEQDMDDGAIGSSATALALPLDGKPLIAGLHHASRALSVVQDLPDAFSDPTAVSYRLLLVMVQCQAQLAALAVRQGKRGSALRWLRLAANSIQRPPPAVPLQAAAAPSAASAAADAAPLSPARRTVYGQLYTVLADVYHAVAQGVDTADIEQEMQEQPRDAQSWLPFPTRATFCPKDREENLLRCNQAYFQAYVYLSVDSCASKGVLETLARKLGNARNELGLLYLDVHRFTRATSYFNLALVPFRSIGDTANQAFVMCNLARVPRIQAHLESQASPGRPLSAEEQALYQRALSVLQDAEAVLRARKHNPRIWDMVQGERGGTMLSNALRLMTLAPEAGPLAPLQLSVADVLQRVPDLLSGAQQRFDALGDSSRSAGAQFHQARWYARLCLDPLYQGASVRGSASNPQKQARLRVTMAQRHLDRAFAVCRADNAPVQFTQLTLDRARILHSVAPGSRASNLATALATLAKLQGVSASLVPGTIPTTLFGQATSQLQLVLRDLVKASKESSSEHQRLRQVYRSVLSVEPDALVSWLRDNLPLDDPLLAASTSSS